MKLCQCFLKLIIYVCKCDIIKKFCHCIDIRKKKIETRKTIKEQCTILDELLKKIFF